MHSGVLVGFASEAEFPWSKYLQAGALTDHTETEEII